MKSQDQRWKSVMAKPARQSTRDRILRGAAQVLAEKGTKGTTVQDMLTASSVSRRTFYQYFANSESVLDALYGQFTEEMINEMGRAITKDGDPLERIHRTVDAYLSVQREHGALAISLQAEANRPDSLLRARREETLDALVGMLDQVMVSLGLRIDPFIYRALLIGIEGLVLYTQREGEFTASDLARVRQVMIALIVSVLQAPLVQLPAAADVK
jgi:AcrR family transcriptional regulator